MDTLYQAFAVAGGLVLIVGILSEVLKKTPLAEPLLGVAVGIAVGPMGFGWFDPHAVGDPSLLIMETALITLAIGLMGTALRIEHDDIRKIWRPASIVLVLGMLGMWGASSLIAAAALGLGLWGALLVGAVITPTDPIVSSAIVTGPVAEENIPGPLQATISIESGANDGLAALFVALPVVVLTHPQTEVAATWLLDHLLHGVVLAVALGVLIGYCAARLLHLAKRKRLIENHSLLSFTVALSLFTLALSRLVETEPLVAVFACGLVFNVFTDTRTQHEEENVQEAVNKLFSLPIFVLFGTALPWGAWYDLGWPLLGFLIAVMLLRRLPVILALHPLLRRRFSWPETAFLAWFGPVGIAALYYAIHAAREIADPLIWQIVSAVILMSILAHGITAASLTMALGRSRRNGRRQE